MSMVHVASLDDIRPRHVVVIALVAFTVLGSCLISSGARAMFLPDGARDWPPDSLFRIVVELFNLQYAYPTPLGFEVKPLIFGLGSAAALIVVGVALALRSPAGDEIEADDIVVEEAARGTQPAQPAKKHISPLLGAQMLMLLYLGWSFASIAWSDARDIALHGSIELAIYTAWPFALAYGLSRGSFRFAAYVVVIAGAATAVMALLYVLERNPTLRASYPIGNPLFLAACLIPPLLLAGCITVAQVRDFGNPRRVRRVLVAALCLAAIAVTAYAFRRTDSRGPTVGLMGGLGALVFFVVKGRAKIGVALLGLLIAVLGVYVLASRVGEHSPTGRDVTLRLRYYAWGYALDLIGQRKVLGHGQGGYTRKADALAAGRDVLDDPEPLKNRVEHAHNEWLEVWADLGSIGFVLVLGGLILTVVAGMSSLPTMPGLTSRWVLIGLLASLCALVIEEAANVALRVAGLPAIYYTVLGLIWAACMPDRPAPVVALRKHGWSRGATALASAAAGVALAYYSLADFQAARAEYGIGDAVEKLHWDEAVRLAGQSYSDRLSPHRRLVAQLGLAETMLHVAQVHQASGFRRIESAMASDPPDPQRMRLGQQDAEIAEQYRRQGMLVLGDLARKASNFYNSNWLEYEFEQIRAAFARAAGNDEAARQFDQNSAMALRRELERKPYDPDMAGRLVLASGSILSVEEICEVLARPLRFNRMSPLYYEIAGRVLVVPEFMERFSPVYAKLRGVSPAEALAQDPLAPEKLRLAAVIWAQEDQPDVAVRALESACPMYDELAPRYAYAAAACWAELVDRRFFDYPAQPDRAVQDAAEAIRRAPPSYEGRQLVASVKDSLFAIHLVRGDETAARAVLAELRPGLDESQIRLAMSGRYAALAGTAMQHEGALYVPLRQWVERALELDPQNAQAWQQKGDLLFREGNDAECVRALREARQWGLPVEVIHRFVDIALRQRPTSRPLLEYRDELAAEIESQNAPAASRPTALVPAGPS